jgi:hypothetical protein
MFTTFEKPMAHWADERFGSHYRRTEGAGRAVVRDGQLRLGEELVLPLPMIDAGCFKESPQATVVILLWRFLFARIEVTVDSRDEGRALLAALGLVDLVRPMSFSILAPAKQTHAKALAINLGGWALMSALGMALVFGARAMGYQLPHWLLLVALLPVAVALMALTWQAGTTPLVLSSDGLTLGRGDPKRLVAWSAIRETELESDGVRLVLEGGETLELRTQAAPKLPDPLKDVVFGAIMAARGR